MKNYLFLFICGLSVFFSGVFFVDAANTKSSPGVDFAIYPGTFYMSIHGDLMDGIHLDGVGSASAEPKTGYWNAVDDVDYIAFYDSSDAPGFRIRFSVGGDFIYDGNDATQPNIPASDFIAFAEWDGSSGQIPTKAFDNNADTLSISSVESCSLALLSEYDFYMDFTVDDYAAPFSTIPFDYLASDVPCVNRGIINLGRFELDMGIPSAGKYSTSLFIIMLDGNL